MPTILLYRKKISRPYHFDCRLIPLLADVGVDLQWRQWRTILPDDRFKPVPSISRALEITS